MSGSFIYNTFMHIKFILPNGDQGIIQSVDEALYLSKLKESDIWFIDREGKHQSMKLKTGEFRLKLALHCNRFREVESILKSGEITGQALLQYLESKGYPDIAIQFV